MPRSKPRPIWAIALRNRRDELGLSQEELAEKTDDLVSQSAVSDLETGRADFAKVETRRIVSLARALKWTLGDLQTATGFDLGVREPPSNLEDKFEGVYIPVYGKVSAGSDEPEPLEGEELGIPNYILKSLQIRNPQRELAGYLVNGNSMFYASDGVRSRGLKHGDFIAVHRFATPKNDDMVVFWDKKNEKMLVKMYEETDEWVVFKSINSSANPPITRRHDDIHVYGVVVFKAGRP